MIAKGEKYCFIDEKEIWNKIYESAKLKIKNEFYEICDTFKMDSQISAAAERKDASEKIDKEKQQRKRKKSKNNGGAEFLLERSKIVENIWKQFIEDENHIIKNESNIFENNNKKAREAAEKVKDFEWIEKLSKIDISDLDTVEMVENGRYEIEVDKLKIFKNGSDKCIQINVDGEEFMIPNMAQFIPGPVEGIKHLDYADEKYDAIILDPPWQNKSVKRLRTYNTFQIDDLYDLPIESLCHSKTAVIIWLTNSPTVHSSINRILESWSLEIYAICHWLKITKNFEPIFPFGSMHKVPFESFIITFPAGAEIREKMIKNDFCVISTPNSCHSRKPPIATILAQLIPELRFDKSLELYGRYLCPRTITIGFEVLKFQHLNSNFDVNIDNKKLI